MINNLTCVFCLMYQQFSVYLFIIQRRVLRRLCLHSWKIHDTSLCSDLFFPPWHNRSDAPHYCGSIRGPEDRNQLVSNPDSALNINIIIKDLSFVCSFWKSLLRRYMLFWNCTFRKILLLKGACRCISLLPYKSRPNEIIDLLCQLCLHFSLIQSISNKIDQ